jgi:hypothetical protein
MPGLSPRDPDDASQGRAPVGAAPLGWNVTMTLMARDLYSSTGAATLRTAPLPIQLLQSS